MKLSVILKRAAARIRAWREKRQRDRAMSSSLQTQLSTFHYSMLHAGMKILIEHIESGAVDDLGCRRGMLAAAKDVLSVVASPPRATPNRLFPNQVP